ncbi:4'-phosphopantetheinyl transferase superfamily protein [Glutamicibacter sp. MNS18]|uniref:4'-phosphopantetheinyl transferase family protein n=1 Tax=Glutamicibacter sp. MNS18 TaxID=2989817 RepID=UPI002236573B|nr:4'-phosphopantetheinyl transferase family protein [Glutamicibacter sp. MNS18]MCW4465676.1 4'-phosphopantetheinyl transferase superfamily protein [Glutamicibacter sp. MNS18]
MNASLTTPAPAGELHYVLATPAEVGRVVDGLGGYDALLGPEAQRAGQLRNKDDAQALLASRALVRLLVAHLRFADAGHADRVQITRTCLDCGPGDHGKPETDGYAISLSRTRELVGAAFGPRGITLGLDVERGEQPEHPGVFAGFDQQVLSPAERDLVARHPFPDRTRLALWSAKEALLKATGNGLRIEPASLPVLSRTGGQADPDGQWHALDMPGGLSPQRLFLCWIHAGETHLASLASSAPLPASAIALQDLLT